MMMTSEPPPREGRVYFELSATIGGEETQVSETKTFAPLWLAVSDYFVLDLHRPWFASSNLPIFQSSPPPFQTHCSLKTHD